MDNPNIDPLIPLNAKKKVAASGLIDHWIEKDLYFKKTRIIDTLDFICFLISLLLVFTFNFAYAAIFLAI